MSTETVLTDEQKDRFVSEICEYGTGFVVPLYSVVEAIEQAVLQSPEVQARMEAYADARVREAQQWQPIETAPKDGTVVMVCNEDGTWIAKYVPIYPSGCRAENPWFSLMLNHDHLRKVRSYRPTHWMPLPAPPADAAMEKQT